LERTIFWVNEFWVSLFGKKIFGKRGWGKNYSGNCHSGIRVPGNERESETGHSFNRITGGGQSTLPQSENLNKLEEMEIFKHAETDLLIRARESMRSSSLIIHFVYTLYTCSFFI